MRTFVWIANILGWPLIHLSIGCLTVRLPQSLFAADNWITAPRACERHGRIYRDWFAIRMWKSRLPDGAPWLGGRAKKGVCLRTTSAAIDFIAETRRAEIAHWAMLCCLPIFFVWNPPWACIVMAAYAVAANLPCILAQRYNRLTLDHLLQARSSLLRQL